MLGFIASTGDRDLLTVETSRGAEQTISTTKYEVTGRGGRGPRAAAARPVHARPADAPRNRAAFRDMIGGDAWLARPTPGIAQVMHAPGPCQ